MPLLINSLWRGHTYTRMHTDILHRISFKKPGAHQPAAGAPGLIRHYILNGRLAKYNLA